MTLILHKLKSDQWYRGYTKAEHEGMDLSVNFMIKEKLDYGYAEVIYHEGDTGKHYLKVDQLFQIDEVANGSN